MSTPFKPLQPNTPKYVEIDYIAPAGECCGFSSSSSGGYGAAPIV